MGKSARHGLTSGKTVSVAKVHSGFLAAKNRSLRGTHTGPSEGKVQPFSTEHAQQKSKNLKVLLANGSHPGLPAANNRSLRGTHTGPSGKKVQPFSTEHAQQKSKNLKVLLANGSHPGLPAANNRSLR